MRLQFGIMQIGKERKFFLIIALRQKKRRFKPSRQHKAMMKDLHRGIAESRAKVPHVYYDGKYLTGETRTEYDPRMRYKCVAMDSCRREYLLYQAQGRYNAFLRVVHWFSRRIGWCLGEGIGGDHEKKSIRLAR